MTGQRAIARPASAAGTTSQGGGQGQPTLPWWHVAWSVPAAVRAVRATIVVPCLFALTFKVIGNEQTTVFAVFGGFGALVMTSFGGTRRDKALAHLGLAVAGSLMIIIGTLVSGSAWLAATVTLPVAFAVFFAGSAGPTAASGVTACLLGYVLPVASAGTATVLPSRLEGWWLAQAASTLAVLVLSTRSPGDRLRTLAANLAGTLSRQLSAALGDAPGSPVSADGGTAAEDRLASVRAKQALRDAFVGTPYRPIGLSSADQALASLIHLLDWCTSLVCELVDGHADLHQAALQERELLAESAVALGQVAALLDGRAATPEPDRLWRARQASAQHLHQFSGDPAAAAVMTDQAFHAQAIGVAVTAAVGETLIALGRASADDVAAERQRWLTGHEDGGQRARSGWTNRLRPMARTATIIAGDASLRSVWFRNSARGAIALAAAVAVAKLIDVQHAFWVVLGTLSVLRTSATATGSTALRALVGTTIGFAIGAVLMLAIGTNPTVLWAVYPVAVLVAAYTPGTAPFAAGQAAFTIAVIVLFNLIVPAGWRVGLLRVEDVAIGCAVSLVVGVLFWPRGTSSVFGDNLADAFRSGAGYLGDATSWALGERGRRPEPGLDAMVAATRLDDAVHGFLTEQGSKRISKADLWALVMAATRLRLTATSLASLPGQAVPAGRGDGERRVYATLGNEAGQLTAFFDEVAAQVGRPGHNGQNSVVVPGFGELGEQQVSGMPGHSPEALWVSHHLAHLNAHSPELTGPAERLARVRSMAWWRGPNPR
jgi:uncharacterized membrane protein YccC